MKKIQIQYDLSKKYELYGNNHTMQIVNYPFINIKITRKNWYSEKTHKIIKSIYFHPYSSQKFNTSKECWDDLLITLYQVCTEDYPHFLLNLSDFTSKIEKTKIYEGDQSIILKTYRDNYNFVFSKPKGYTLEKVKKFQNKLILRQINSFITNFENLLNTSFTF